MSTEPIVEITISLLWPDREPVGLTIGEAREIRDALNGALAPFEPATPVAAPVDTVGVGSAYGATDPLPVNSKSDPANVPFCDCLACRIERAARDLNIRL